MLLPAVPPVAYLDKRIACDRRCPTFGAPRWIVDLPCDSETYEVDPTGGAIVQALYSYS